MGVGNLWNCGMRNGVDNLLKEKSEMHVIGQIEKSRDHADSTD